MKPGKQIILFYKDAEEVSEVKGANLYPEMPMNAFLKTLERFDNGDIRTLLVPTTLLTGWSSRVPQEDILISFVGQGWTNEEVACARCRVQFQQAKR